MTSSPAERSSALERAQRAVDDLHTRGRDLGAVEQVLSGWQESARESDERVASGCSRGPLEGIPFAVKANIDIAGVPTTSGLDVVDAPPATADAWAVHLLRQAGAIPVATATMAPLAIGAVTEHPRLGPCRNPHDLTRHAGGSSGGSGALVGAGIVEFALGSDTMGSVRIPAAYCQAYAWLPTHGSVSPRGLAPLAESMDNIGVVADRVPLLLDVARVLLQPDPIEPWWHGAPDTPDACEQGSIHIGTCSLTDAADSAGREAAADLVDAMVALGAHHVDRLDFVELGIDPAVVRRRGLLLVEAAAADRFGAQLDAHLVPESIRPLLEYGRSISGPRLWSAIRELVAYRRRVRNALVGIDILALPTTATSAPLIGEDPSDAADFTAWVNVAGLPVVVVPWGSSSVQLVGQPGADIRLLDCAMRLIDAQATA